MTEQKASEGMSDDIVFIDTETTGLDPDHDPIWEVAAIADGEEYRWLLPIHVGLVSEWVEENCRFSARYDLANITQEGDFLDQFAAVVRGRHVCGNVVSFDTERLGKLYRENGLPIPWHYHIIDVEPMVVGWLAAKGVQVDLPWSSRDLSAAIAVDVPDGIHDAMVDARWSRDLYRAVMS